MKRQSLNGQWTLLSACGQDNIPANVPGTLLHTLLEQHLVADPFDGLNEYDVCKLFEKDYTFARTFTPDAELLAQPNADLVFDGLDTLASVTLNGQAVLHADNMHRTWRVPVRELLRGGENTLSIAFASPLAFVREKARENPDVTYTPAGSIHGTSFLRKAHCQFGWDWGPQLPDTGVWRDVTLEGYDTRIVQARLHQTHGAQGVLLRAEVETDAPGVRLRVFAPDGTLCGEDTGAQPCVRIDKPLLWWPNGLGQQPLYRAEISAGTDERVLRVGLRTLTVSREKDAYGEEFAFTVNSVKFFAMGADYIPQDSVFTRMTAERTQTLLHACAKAHFNCVRVWGGGAYPSDAFFDACDELGLVVWQDLMYACNVYKLDDAFEANIVAETRDVLRRIRHHASLGLLCGNNEMETAWADWDKVMCHSPRLKADYLKQFEFILARICCEEAPEVFWWPSSPSSGGSFDAPNAQDRGDVHDWSVWHGRRPFTDYQLRYPRFCSEFGFESFPSMRTLQTFAHDARALSPFSEVMESHQKCTGGNGTMLYYLSQYLPYPESMEALARSTQFLQGEAMRHGVEHWRRHRGRCMGAVYWQLNDCWPTASWASIDYFGRWKALHYMAARFFAPVLLSCARKDTRVTLNVSNETREPVSGTVCWAYCDARGAVLYKGETAVSCAPMTAVNLPEMIFENDRQRVLRYALLDADGRVVSRGEELFCAPKHFAFDTPHLRWTVTQDDGGSAVTLQTDAFCIGVSLEAGEALFEDNWFALYPEETRVVRTDRPITMEELTVCRL